MFSLFVSFASILKICWIALATWLLLLAMADFEEMVNPSWMANFANLSAVLIALCLVWCPFTSLHNAAMVYASLADAGSEVYACNPSNIGKRPMFASLLA